MEVWRDVSLIWLISLTIVSVLPAAVLGFFAIKGMNALRRVVRKYAPVAQDKARLVATKTDEISGRVAQPFIATGAAAARVQGMTRTISRRNQT